MNLGLRIIFASSLLATGALANTDLEGVYGGREYDIELDDSFDEIEGEWGDREYDLDIDESFKEIDGTIDGQEIEIEWDTSFKELEGNLPCGDFEIDYSESFKSVEGEICGGEVDIDLDDNESAWLVARGIVIDTLLESFPLPTRSAIRRFIYSYMPRRG